MELVGTEKWVEVGEGRGKERGESQRGRETVEMKAKGKTRQAGY